VRVTDRILFERGASNIAASRERAESAQQVAATGLRVESPGDDAGAAGVLAAAPIAEQRFRAIGAAAAAASGELQAADGALGSIANSLTRARELATQLASDSYGASQRASGAAEVDGLVQDIVSQLNTQVGSRYVFSGVNEGTPPFDLTKTPAYQGGAQRTVEIAPGVYQPSSVAAGVAMDSGGPNDVLKTLSDLSAALRSNSGAGVQATLDRLASAVDEVGTARAQAGVSMNAFDAASAASQTAADGVKERAAHLSDEDIATAATQLAFAQTALQASMAATAQGFKLSLVDYLR
jgi:flagellar hook-associated protein 3 FlgL